MPGPYGLHSNPGLTLGRIFFSLPFVHIRERVGNTVLLAFLCLAIVLLWIVSSAATNWIAIGIAGFFLGYVYARYRGLLLTGR